MDKDKLRDGRIKAMEILYVHDLLKLETTAVSEEHDRFVKELISKYTPLAEKINNLISENLENYTIDRLNFVDRAIIRLAVCELLSGTPKPVVINEYLEITKEFSETDDYNSRAFNNRLLDKIAKSI
ncbi:MAG: transcription antitermination protein NusB [Erysipelotrichales bacterium]|nr:transcription antitermination protein NusB [Erysipelotrichales bacterium]